MSLLYGRSLSPSEYLIQRLQDDFRLVISNAKTFNPPGTIYHTEAERIEAWASDHISKAASYVIEYETDWNIEIDRDEEVNVDADEDAAAGRVSAGPDTPTRRSPSATSASLPAPNRRGRNATKKEGFSETVEPDGHLPGYKDGVGIFPPGSDWAEVMLALKLKGKPPFRIVPHNLIFFKAKDIVQRRNACVWRKAVLHTPLMGV
jgi:bromodomain-containing protein 7